MESIVKQQPKIAGMTCEMAQRAIALRSVAGAEWLLDGSSESAAQARSEAAFKTHSDLTTTTLISSQEPAPFDDIFDGLDDAQLAALLATDFPLISNTISVPEQRPVALTAQDAVSSSVSKVDADGAGGDALNEHLRQCRACQAEMAATSAFFRALASESGPEPSATLLARARQQLDATLDSCGQDGLWIRFTQQLAFTGGRMRAAPVLCSMLLFAGLLAGGYAGYHAGVAAHNADQTALLLAPPVTDAPSVVADVSSIAQDPQTGMIEVRYDRLVPDVLTASPNDPSIRELLMAGAQNGVDPMVRNASLSLLSTDCGAGSSCAQTPVRSALLNALETDKTPEVRREALAELQPYIADDMQVRDAVLDALMRDPSAAVRIEAVRMLQPVDVDSSVRQVLHTVAASDGDPSIRSASLAALKTMTPLQ
jgi:hypothetical protein